MTHPRRAIDYTPRAPRRYWPALAAAGVLLTSGGIGAVATLPARADAPTPTPTPTATPEGGVTPTPSATPTAPGTPAPTGAAAESPAADADKTRSGGLASTGV